MKEPLVGEIQTSESGKFAHIPDPLGNKIGLWEPEGAGRGKPRAARPPTDRP
jgi:hypothetical protein